MTYNNKTFRYTREELIEKLEQCKKILGVDEEEYNTAHWLNPHLKGVAKVHILKMDIIAFLSDTIDEFYLEECCRQGKDGCCASFCDSDCVPYANKECLKCSSFDKETYELRLKEYKKWAKD